MTRKIKQITVLTTEGNQPLQETLGDRFSKARRGWEGGLSLKKAKEVLVGKTEPESSLEDDDNDKTERSTSSQESALSQIFHKIFDAVNGETRVLLWLSKSELESNYLIAGGPEKIVKNASDAQIEAIFGNKTPTPAQRPLIFMKAFRGERFKLKDVTDRPMGRDRCVLLNVPDALANKITAVNDVKKARQAMTEIIAHKHYVGTLNVSTIVSSNLQEMSGDDTYLEQFDPKIISAWGTRYLIDAAKEEFEQKESSKVTESDEEIIRDVVKDAIKAFIIGVKERKHVGTTAVQNTFFGTIKSMMGLVYKNDKNGAKRSAHSKLAGREHLIPHVIKAFRTDDGLEEFIKGDEDDGAIQRAVNIIAPARQKEQEQSPQGAEVAPQSQSQAADKSKMSDRELEKLRNEAGMLQVGQEEITAQDLADKLRRRSPNFLRALEADLYGEVLTKKKGP